MTFYFIGMTVFAFLLFQVSARDCDQCSEKPEQSGAAPAVMAEDSSHISPFPLSDQGEDSM